MIDRSAARREKNSGATSLSRLRLYYNLGISKYIIKRINVIPVKKMTRIDQLLSRNISDIIKLTSNVAIEASNMNFFLSL